MFVDNDLPGAAKIHGMPKVFLLVLAGRRQIPGAAYLTRPVLADLIRKKAQTTKYLSELLGSLDYTKENPQAFVDGELFPWSDANTPKPVPLAEQWVLKDSMDRTKEELRFLLRIGETAIADKIQTDGSPTSMTDRRGIFRDLSLGAAKLHRPNAGTRILREGLRCAQHIFARELSEHMFGFVRDENEDCGLLCGRPHTPLLQQGRRREGGQLRWGHDQSEK